MGLDWASVKLSKPQSSPVIELGWWKADNKDTMAPEPWTQFPTSLEYKQNISKLKEGEHEIFWLRIYKH